MIQSMTEPSNRSVLLRRARIVGPDRTIEGGSVLVESGRIAGVFDVDRYPSSDADSVIDLGGVTVFPGFIDIHIHGAVGVDTMDASAEDLGRVGQFLASQGVTAWLPTLVPSAAPQYTRAVKAIDKLLGEQMASSTVVADQMSALPVPQARVLGVHYEGPFVNNEQCGALHREHFRTFLDTADLETLPTLKNEGAVHLMTLAPEIEGGIELISELKKRGWIVSIGHTRATVDVLDRALRAGARHMTHFMNAMTPLHHRSPGAVGWGLIHDEVTCDLIADGVHLDPLVIKLILRAKTAKRISLISDAIAATGLGDGEYQVWGEQILVKEGRTQNPRGSIAGSVITMLDAVRMMLSLGVPQIDVARMASANPARLLQIEKDCGSIEVGKRADLVALDHAGNVSVTVVAGRPFSSDNFPLIKGK
jgi:N-acetylglucosamine-6-phosphate deacetylase